MAEICDTKNNIVQGKNSDILRLIQYEDIS